MVTLYSMLNSAGPLGEVFGLNPETPPLELAVQLGHVDFVEAVLCQNLFDDPRETVLNLIVFSVPNSPEVAKFLLLSTPIITAQRRCSSGMEKLEPANLEWQLCGCVREQSLDLLTLLLHHQVDVTEGRPLCEASDRGYEDIAVALLAQGAGVDHHSDQTSMTPMFRAIEQGRVSIVRILLAAGADVHRASPLSHAFLFVQTKLLEVLCLHKFLCVAGCFLLLERTEEWWGCARKTDGNMPLLAAVSWMQPEIVSLLLSHGANVHCGRLNSPYAAPVLAARLRGSAELVSLLLEHGADFRKPHTDVFRVPNTAKDAVIVKILREHRQNAFVGYYRRLSLLILLGERVAVNGSLGLASVDVISVAAELIAVQWPSPKRSKTDWNCLLM